MTALEIITADDLIAYLNENTHEAMIEVSDIECDCVCRIRSLKMDYEEVKAIDVEIITINGIPAKWFHPNVIRLVETRLAYCEEIVVDIRSTVQYVLDMKSACDGDYTGGDEIDRQYERRTA